ncbi:hypothetical protein [Noviherbaspirillum sp. ST9]|uniref:hypothetical protein n=1 Tax=Noviherbaspirillum sp. ST9 TaxID=3401606 RepID=UPI003B589370
MSTLMIKDLAIASDLDRAAMSSVRGGYYKGAPSCWTPSYCAPSWGMPTSYAPEQKFSFDASQMIGQSQNVQNNNGNNVAFASGITSTVNPTQSANNNINF